MPPLSTTRPPTDEELALLRQPMPRGFGWWTGIGEALLVFVFALLGTLLLSPWLPLVAIPWIALAVGAFAAVAVFLRVQRKARERFRELSNELARDLAPGHVISTTYTVVDAVAVEEAEDEGLSYYLLLDDGRTLFLTGQYLYGPADEQEFPWAAFEIVRAPVGGWVLRLVRTGPALRVSYTRPAFSEAELEAGSVPSDGDILAVDFAALKTPAERR